MKRRKTGRCTKWAFNTKVDESGKVVKFKSGWVVKFYMHAHGGIDYNLKHDSVSRMSTLRDLISLAVKLNLNDHQMDDSTEFLPSTLEDEIIYENSARVRTFGSGW